MVSFLFMVPTPQLEIQYFLYLFPLDAHKTVFADTLRFFTCLHIHLITKTRTYLFTDLTISILVCPLLFNIPSGNE